MKEYRIKEKNEVFYVQRKFNLWLFSFWVSTYGFRTLQGARNWIKKSFEPKCVRYHNA